jgi:hypothetical protein
MPNRSVHVVPGTGGWAVEREHVGRGRVRGSVSYYPTQDEAIAAGRKLAQEEKAELVIHGRDGRVRQRDNYAVTTPPTAPGTGQSAS